MNICIILMKQISYIHTLLHINLIIVLQKLLRLCFKDRIILSRGRKFILWIGTQNVGYFFLLLFVYLNTTDLIGYVSNLKIHVQN